MYWKFIRILVYFLYVFNAPVTVEGWSCSSMSKVFSTVNNDVTFRFTVTVTTTPTLYTVNSFNTYLGSVIVSTAGVRPYVQPGVSISGDVTGNMEVKLFKVSSAGLYRIESTNLVNKCLFLYILGQPTQPRITSDKDPTVGENVKLTCGSSTSTTVPSNHSLSMKYTWKINNADISTNPRYILSNTGASLTVMNVDKTDTQSVFTCTAQEDVSQGYISDNSKNFAINVLYPPDGRPTIGNYNNGNTYNVMDETTGTLPCTIKGGNPRPTLTWTCYNQAGIYTYPDTQTVTRTVRWTAARGTDSKCTCRCPAAVSGQQSTYVNVKILYPPSTPSFTINSEKVSGANIKVTKGKSFSVTCNSSSEPAPSSYTWKRPDGSSLLNQSLTVNNVQTSHNGQYLCEVENTMSPSSGGTVPGKADKEIQLLVLFPPSLIVLTFGSGNGQEITVNTVHVIEEDHVNIVCTSTAEPGPEYKWNYKGQISTGTVLTFLSISSDMTGSGTCTATNTMIQTAAIGGQEIRTATATVSINVMYPPSKPSMKFKYQFGSKLDVSDSLKIVEGRNFTVTCYSASKPVASYSWSSTVTTTATTNKELHIGNVNRQQDGTYTCQVSNTMVRSFGATVTGKNSTTFVLVVLYPPEIGALPNRSIVEGSSLQLPCSYIAGSPAETTFKWTRNGNQRVWTTQQLTISNVSRTDDMMYTCSIYNTMNPTNELEVKGERSRSFHLNVLYKTSISSFYIHGFENKETVTVDETTDVDFTCHVTSNPVSRISVLFHDNVIKSVNGSSMTHTTKALTCLDTGIYKCAGQNDYNAGTPSVKIVTLYVQCRPSVYNSTQENVTSAQNDHVTLNVRILAHPRPDLVTWQKWHGNKWISVEESDLVKTSALPLQISETLLSVTQLSLTFLNVTQSNYGQYRIVAKNSISNVTQQFYLQAQDKPDQPTDLKFMMEQKSTLKVQWKPGFHGSLKQTFILIYKREKDVEWKKFEIADTGEEIMSFTIPNLSPGTSYQLKIYARNKIGNSSITEILLIQTIDDGQLEESNNATLIGSIVGGLAFIAAALAGTLLLLRRFWTIKVIFVRKKSNGGDGAARNQEYEDLNVSGQNSNSTQLYSSLRQNTDEQSTVREDPNVYINLTVS